MIVVDASIAVKWFLPEPDSPTALIFAGRVDADFHAPDIILVEVASAIVRGANERRLSRGEAAHALDLWTRGRESGQIALHRLDAGLVNHGAEIAVALGHPLADCLYLALARELNCELATADVKFRDRALDLYPRIRLLTDYS